MDDLVSWLRAQLDDDERVARQVMAEPGGFYLDPETDQDNIMTVAAHVLRWTPKRVLAEIEAKRQILELHSPEPSQYVNGRYICDQPGTPQCEYCASLCHSGSGLGCDKPDAPYPCPTVRLLALPFADRAGYLEEWRPLGPVAVVRGLQPPRFAQFDHGGYHVGPCLLG